jgi:CheY-like chemotaxis protein
MSKRILVVEDEEDSRKILRGTTQEHVFKRAAARP